MEVDAVKEPNQSVKRSADTSIILPAKKRKLKPIDLEQDQSEEFQIVDLE